MPTHTFIKLPPDGAGKALHTSSIIENGQEVHNQIMTIGDPFNGNNMQYVDPYGSAYVRFAEGNQIFDSFGKSKISQETMIGEYMPTYDTLPKKVQTNITGGASEVYVPNESSIRLICGTANGDKVQRTTNKYHRYYPGTSQLAEFTVVVGDFGKANVVRRWGYYDDANGIMFSVDGTSFNIIQRSSTSGVVVDTVIPQASFNVDKADGTGISGLIMDPSKANIYWIDLQWLGAGRVRIGGYNPNGSRIVFHEIRNANSSTSVYMGTGSLPLRWEQFNTGIAASTSEMKILNAAVYSETDNLLTKGQCFSTASFTGPITPKITKIDNTFDTSVSIRPKLLLNGKINRTAIIPSQLMINTDKPLQVSIMKNITTAGAETWTSVHADSAVEKSGNIVLVDIGNNESQFCTIAPVGVNIIDLYESFDYLRTYLHNNADGTQPVWSIIFRTLDGTSASVIAGMTWTELKI